MKTIVLSLHSWYAKCVKPRGKGERGTVCGHQHACTLLPSSQGTRGLKQKVKSSIDVTPSTLHPLISNRKSHKQGRDFAVFVSLL